jgi:esterase/lipase superfamily enzyme
MRRDYSKWHSGSLGREMELLVFGDSGTPAVVFPTSGGRFYEFEDHGMVAALTDRIEAGQLQLFCLDSVDRESWYSRQSGGRPRIERQLAFERYVVDEVLPVLQAGDTSRHPMAVGCSFGAYHAANLTLRHPEMFSGFVALSGIFDLAEFLDGYYDTDCYLNLPTHYLPNLTDRRYLDAYAQGRYILATGWDDQCLSDNQHLDRVLTEQGIGHEFHIWNGLRTHDWPTWQRMVREYL